MKTKCFVFLSLVASMTLGSQYAFSYGRCDFHNWYLSGTAGLEWHSNTKLTTVTGFEEIKYKPGWSGGFNLGYMFEHARFEIEGLYTYNSIDRVNTYQVNLYNDLAHPQGHNEDIALLANAFYYLIIGDYFSINFGIGGGVSWNEFQIRSYFVDLGGFDVFFRGITEKQSLLTWQLILNLSYEHNDCFVISGGYRYVGMQTPKEFNRFNSDFDDQITNVQTIPIKQIIELRISFLF